MSVVYEVLANFSPNVKAAHWEIKCLVEGIHGRVLLAIEPHSEPVVVKLYETKLDRMETKFECEVNSLSLAHKFLNNKAFGDWIVKTPELLYVSRQPLALVESFVPGIQLEDWLLTANSKSCENQKLIAQTIVDSYEAFWNATNSIIGDVNFKNILIYEAGHTLSLVDFGSPNDHHLCSNVAGHYFPASRDFGYLLFAISATNVKKRIINRKVARRRSDFVRAIIKLGILKLGNNNVGEFTREIYDCSLYHIDQIKRNTGNKKLLGLSGIKDKLIGEMAVREIVDILESIKIETP